MNKYVVGIDGGGSKTEFVIADQEAQILWSHTINQGCNPSYNGLEASIEVLSSGLNLCRSNEVWDGVCYIYAGLSGCINGGRYKTQFEELIKSYEVPFSLDGDIDSNYRAYSSRPEGILALSGTGNTLAIYRDSQAVMFKDEVAVSGRSFGHLLLAECLRQPSNYTHTIKVLEEQFGNLNKIKERTVRELYIKDLERVEFSGALAEQSRANSNVVGELDTILHIIALRWSFAVTRHALLYGLDVEQEFPLVLSGSFWKWDLVREQVAAEVIQCFENIQLVYQPEIRPVQGCIQLAWQNSKIF